MIKELTKALANKDEDVRVPTARALAAAGRAGPEELVRELLQEVMPASLATGPDWQHDHGRAEALATALELYPEMAVDAAGAEALLKHIDLLVSDEASDRDEPCARWKTVPDPRLRAVLTLVIAGDKSECKSG